MRRTAVTLLRVAIAGVFSILLLGQTYPVRALATDEVGSFSATSSLPLGSSSSTAVIYNDYIYQVAGSTTQFQTSLDVNFAHINPDGTIGEWSATTSLPNAVYDSSTVVYNGYIYEVGGSPNGGNGSSTTVYYAPLNNDGTIGTWATTTSMPHQLVNHTAIVNNGYLYAVAGMDTTAGLSDKVYYAPINNDGTVGTWTQGGTIPNYSANGSAVIYNNFLYVMGGYGNSFNPSSSAYYAPLNIDGSVGAWQTSGNAMPNAVIGGNAVVNNGHVYMIGGGSDGGQMSNLIYFASLNSDGSVGTWQTSATRLPEEITDGANVVNNGYLYNVGGYTGSGAGRSDSVNYAAFITSSTADTDNDGALDTEENAGPNNGDANDDGTPDSEQANVLSYENPLTDEYAVLETDCDSIENFQIGGESAEQADKDFDYPMGLASFWIRCENPGDTAQVKQYFFNNQGSQYYTVRKWKNDGSYAEIPGYEKYGMLIDTPVFVVQYDLTDGSAFDDDGEENGLIIDPSGPAFPVTATSSSISGASSNLASTGQSNQSLLYLSLALMGTPLFILTRGRKHLS